MTIADVVKITSENAKEFEIHLGDFLDEFYAANKTKKKNMVKDEPEYLDSISQ